jgi:cell division protein FtsB
MRHGKVRKSSNFNPLVSLTDILFNFILMLVFVSAIFAQDIDRKFAENRAFQDRLNNMKIERDSLIESVEKLTGDLDEVTTLKDDLAESNLSLEEQIAVLVSNLDTAQQRQETLNQQIAVILGDLGDANLEKRMLEQKLTVILGDLDIAEDQKKLLEQQVTVVLGDLDEAEKIALALREQVSLLSRNNFLVIELEWREGNHDMDLHLIDPNGKRFYWGQPSYRDVNASITLDNRVGAQPEKPALEIFTARDLIPGVYSIEVGLWGCLSPQNNGSYQRCDNDGNASVLIRHRDGDDLISNITVPLDQTYSRVNLSGTNPSEKMVLVAEIEVFEEQGKMGIRVKPTSGLTVNRLASNEQ